ncbi:MAG: hypothetical protein ABGY42_06875, partial [bacterium]
MGKPPGASTEACLVSDLRGKLERARGTTLTAEARHCDVAPVFAYSSAAVVNEAAVRETIGLQHDVFGQNLDTVMVDRDADRYAAICQSSAAKSSAKLLATTLRQFVDCKKQGLRDGSLADATTLEQTCFGAITSDLGGKISRAKQKLARVVEKKCVSRGVD